MAGPSTHWDGFEGLDPEGDLAKSISTLIAKANFDFLKEKALATRKALDPGREGPLDCTINTQKFASGFAHVVFEVKFTNGQYWVARIGIADGLNDSEAEADMHSEVATIAIVRERTTIPVPAVFTYEASSNNHFGFPYMLMDALEGRPLKSGLARSVPLPYFGKVANQLAQIYFQLGSICFAKIGRLSQPVGEQSRGDEDCIIPFAMRPGEAKSGPFATSLEYFFLHRQSQNRASLSLGHDSDDWPAACWVLSQALPTIVQERLMCGPFPLCHMDLHYGNILLDDEYNITGILDWSGAQTVPWERFAASPEFLTFPGLSEKENAPITAFTQKVADSLHEFESKARATRMQLGPSCDLSALIGSLPAELACRCTYSHPWRALSDARLVARLLYGSHISWDDLKRAYNDNVKD